jgi:hypothetical protein
MTTVNAIPLGAELTWVNDNVGSNTNEFKAETLAAGSGVITCGSNTYTV